VVKKSVKCIYAPGINLGGEHARSPLGPTLNCSNHIT
jgi:hypothetical protein